MADFCRPLQGGDGVASFSCLVGFAALIAVAPIGVALVISDDAIIDRLGVDPMPQAEKMSRSAGPCCRAALFRVGRSGYGRHSLR